MLGRMPGANSMSDGVATMNVGRSARGKALWLILPLVLLPYLRANLERINVGFAALRMNVDTGAGLSSRLGT